MMLLSVERPGWVERSRRLYKSSPKGRPVCLILGLSVPCDLGLRAGVLRAGKAQNSTVTCSRWQLWNSLVTAWGKGMALDTWESG